MMKLEFLDFEFSEAKKNSIQALPQNINTNINLDSVDLDKNNLNVRFTYTVSYVPDGSYIRMSGVASFSGQQETKAAYDEWKKSSKIGGSAGEQIINTINYSTTVNAIFIARVFNLAPPVVLPTIKFEEQKKK